MVITVRRPCGMKRGFPIDPSLFHNSALPLFSCKVTGCVSEGSQGHCVCVCVCVCHTWTTCWCPAWRASQSSARTSCVTCATTHIACEKVTALSLEEWLGDPVCVHRLTPCPTSITHETLMCCTTSLASPLSSVVLGFKFENVRNN